jgi:hypothetical protein
MKRKLDANKRAAKVDLLLAMYKARQALDYALVERLEKEHPELDPPAPGRTWVQETAWLEMHDAHLRGDLKHVKRMLKDHPWLEQTGSRDQATWVPLAVRGNSVAVTKFWLEKGFNPEIANSLFDAQTAAMTELLLEHGADPKSYYGPWGTPLHKAKEPEQIRLLLAAGVDPSITDDEGVTPLGKMKSLGRSLCAEALIEANAPEHGQLHPTEVARRASLAKTVKIDIRKETPALAAYIRTRVKQHSASKAGRKPTKIITFGYELGQAGWVVLHFDTRPNAEPDGDWTLEIDRLMLPRPHWPIWHKMADDASY